MVRKHDGFKENGQSIFKYIGYFRTYQEAVDALLSYNKNGDIDVQPQDNFSFKAIYEALCETKFEKIGKCIPNPYSSSYKRLEKLSELCFKDITLFQYEEIFKTIDTPALQRNAKTLLNQMYIYAIKHDVVDKNLAQRIDIDKYVNGEIHKIFTDEEIRLLWEHQEDWEAKLWLIYIYTGMRPSELRIMKMEDVHLKEQYMIGGVKNDYSKNRMIPLADCIIPLVKSLYDKSQEYLLRYDKSRKSGAIIHCTLSDALTNYMKSFGSSHLLHDGRHTFATIASRFGIDILIIQKIMGHSPKALVEKTYIHKDLSELLDAVNKLPTKW